MNFQSFVIILLIAGFILPSFGLAQTAQAPQTIEEAESLGLDILNRLPDAIKTVWQTQALPIWLGMWQWTKGFWESNLGYKFQAWLQKLMNSLGIETPDVKNEFQKEQQEMQKDLWDRFKDLLK